MGQRVITSLEVTDKLIARFMDKVYKSSNSCWLWYSSMNWKGYGRFHIAVKKNEYLSSHAHRVSYIIHNGKIPENMTVHHKCNNKNCVNPKHLELKTNKENRLLGNCWSAVNTRKTHCKHGHPFLEENTYIYYREYNGKLSKRRGCRECRKIKLRKYRKRNKN